ncbi:hypothetical protein C8R46DRAFT_553164 [Mycena filopes]|nr:hypothetical protein C8R46DRAFT_553164 [Mycena filopes]
MAELKDTHSVNTTEEKARREGVKPMFLAKVNVLNQAIVECGLGRYQWELFISAGFGFVLFLRPVEFQKKSSTHDKNTTLEGSGYRRRCDPKVLYH